MNIINFQDFINRFYSGEDFILFDTETTGLNTYHDDIIEIGAFVWGKNGKKEEFESLIKVNPNKISEAAWQVHKIPLDEIESAGEAKHIFNKFLDFTKNRTLVAHNIRFDFNILNSNLIRNNMNVYSNSDVACSLAYAKEQGLPGKLSKLADYYKIDTKTNNLHRALYDVEVLMMVLEKMLKDHEPEEMQYSLIL